MINREASRLRQEFWTTFGRYMSPISSAEGLKINWLNYHTGVKDLYFRMDAGNRSAAIAISIEHRDPDIQRLYFEQLMGFTQILEDALQEKWTWHLHKATDDGRVVSRVFKELPDVSVFNKKQWHELISFFKPRIIALDSFWENAKYSFEGLA